MRKAKPKARQTALRDVNLRQYRRLDRHQLGGDGLARYCIQQRPQPENIPLATQTLAMQASPSLRRQRLAPGAPLGVTEEMCRDLVHAFYARIRADPILGPIFNSAIGDRWDAHLAKLSDFWSSVMLMTGRFKGSPMVVHTALPRAEPDDFQRWLSLFRQTADEICPPEAAALFCAKAEMIAQSLQLGIAASRGQLPPEFPRPGSAIAPPNDIGDVAT